jgi:FkbM family methyltransferase
MLSTARKVAIARLATTTLLHLGLKPRRHIRRRGLAFDVDIREGIDLSLFLFGSFQRHIVDAVKRYVPRDGVVIDIGANVGAVTLPMAAHVNDGHVYAIEPTEFAHAKLLKNIELNPALAPRITPVKLFLADATQSVSELVAYSSWPVVATGESHPVHKGVAMEATCGQMTLDDFVAGRGIASLSLIKIDTDGHEYKVLSGATRTLVELRPVVIFEACQYLMEPPSPVFHDFERLFAAARYTIRDAHGRPLTADAFRRQCPAGGGLDLLAVPL